VQEYSGIKRNVLEVSIVALEDKYGNPAEHFWYDSFNLQRQKNTPTRHST